MQEFGASCALRDFEGDNMKRLIAGALALFVLATGARAEGGKDTFKSLEDGRAMAERMLSDYVHKDAAEAIRSLPRLSTSKTEEEQRLAIQKLVAWNVNSSEKRGASLGYKFESSRSISEVVTRLRFIVLGERMPLEWDFYFYRPGTDRDWQLADIHGGSGAMNLFEPGDR
jgi:hypothetical protein